MKVKFNRIRAGWYATEDGRWAAVVDGYGHISAADTDGDGVDAGVVGNEWAAVFDPQGRLRDDHQAGEPLGWFATKRDAVAYCIDSQIR